MKLVAAFISFTLFSYLTTKVKGNFPETYTFGQFLKNDQSKSTHSQFKLDETHDGSDHFDDGGE
ncbi:hypothetical protein JCM9140_3951 [Halalkalibacter wakoensis JCM 9140]|uniref:Uncharacterized protein n=1 Tax=Halalkalibacter wakoensis JCM 9140 TaxID=1236970 RepID=W4Q708_9BACI|nr:hypothetical protein [Halalkalibacter wakoensis]GAE27792.1 hypothetical protein JCM9140_3951 [Halalkalibacter wakoensis JCM 9140]